MNEAESNGDKTSSSLRRLFQSRGRQITRTPSVVITDEVPDDRGGQSSSTNDPEIKRSDSTTSWNRNNNVNGRPQCNGSSGRLLLQGRSLLRPQPSTEDVEKGCEPQTAVSRLKKLRRVLLGKEMAKSISGIFLSCVLACAWSGMTHTIRYMYLRHTLPPAKNGNRTALYILIDPHREVQYDCPFLTTWLCTVFIGLTCPIYLLAQVIYLHDKTSIKNLFQTSFQSFTDRGVSFFQIFLHCLLFCLLWVINNYLYIRALRALQATDVMALYATNVGFVYLLSWVILHEQFVGIRIVALIMCNTGVALLAYMDGVMETKTLGGVVLAAAAAAAAAVYKVLLRKVLGPGSFHQLAVFTSIISLCNTLLFWPVILSLHFSSAERIPWPNIPWILLLMTGFLNFVANFIGNFGSLITYDFFIALGLVLAIPASGVLDNRFYGIHFEGMRLAGIILIFSGFLIVLLPENWPEYITKCLRYGRRRHPQHNYTEEQDLRTGYHSSSRLRTLSGQVR